MRKKFKRILAGLLAAVFVLMLTPSFSPEASAASDAQVTAALAEAESYINAIIPSTSQITSITSTFKSQFSWDNEKRESGNKSYLFEWSYYNGVVFEGLDYVSEATGDTSYFAKTEAYLAAMINGTTWKNCTNNSSKKAAGYVNTHGLDCYKSASMLLRHGYTGMASVLYADLQSAESRYASSSIGGNFYHTWSSTPTYKVWLDGIYMAQPFMAQYASYINDTAELSRIAARFTWINNNMYDSGTGLYYHAANSASNHSSAFWLRAIGWYAAAIVDVIPYMSGANQTSMIAQLKKLVDGMLPYQGSNGMWRNFVNNSSAAYETSGTALMAYAILKGVNNGWLNESYAAYGESAFVGICENYLNNNSLSNICFKGSPDGANNTFYSNEGKGIGPFIMAYAQMVTFTAEPAHEHTYTAEITAPTCTEPGYTTYTCACGDSFTADQTDALGHDFTVEVIEPTCTAAGERIYSCTRCGYSRSESIPALGHAYVEQTTEADCTHAGTTTYVCEQCRDTYTVEMPALGHDYVSVTYPATCTEDGSVVHTCSRCSDSWTELLPAAGHDYLTETVAPTCTAQGYTVHTCTHCHDSYVTDYVPATGHAYSAVITSPTCTEQGYTTYTCTTCGYSYTADYVAALGHEFETEVTAPTCTEEGYTTHTCTYCGQSYVTNRVEALGHAYTAVVTAPTCTAQGYTTYICSRCGDSYSADFVAAHGHDYVCEETATEYVYTCSICGDSYSEPIVHDPTYPNVTTLQSGNAYLIIVKGSGNRYYALTHNSSSLSKVQVTLSNNQITSTVTDAMLWNYNGSTFSYVNGSRTYSLKASGSSGWGWFGGGSSATLSLTTGTGSQVTFSNSRLQINGYYLYYSGSSITVNRSSYSTVKMFKQTY